MIGFLLTYITNSLGFLLVYITNSLGYDIRRVPRASDIAAASIRSGDPITCEYMPRLRGAAMFDINVEDARGLQSLGLQFRSETHPFVRAAAAVRKSASATEAHEVLQEVLSDYYREVCPSSALEAVDIREVDAPGLKGVSATGWLFPWDHKSIAEVTRARQTAMRFDALQYGKMLAPGEGITSFGPVGARKLSLEVARLNSLVASLAQNGFGACRKNPLKVIGLRRDNSYRWLVRAGQHRFAVCAAFSIRSVPAMVIDIVRREDCDYWPQVVAGTYTPQGALTFFDRLYDGVPARVCEDWMRRTSQSSGAAPQSETLFMKSHSV